MIKYLMTIFLITFGAIGITYAQSTGILDSLRWKKRILLMFTNSDTASLYRQQKRIWDDAQRALSDRDIVSFIITKTDVKASDGKDYGQHTAERLRKEYRIKEQPFAVILIGKDGGEKLREYDILANSRLFSTIDAMPMRRREMGEDKKR